MTGSKRRNYLIAAAMAVVIVLCAIFVYRCAVHGGGIYGLQYVLRGYPDTKAMPELGKQLTGTHCETFDLAYIRFTHPIQNSADSVLEIEYEHNSPHDTDQLLREALEIRAVTEQYMAAHPEQFDGQRVMIEFSDRYDASPNFIRFLNYDGSSKAEPDGLMFGVMNLCGGSVTLLQDVHGFVSLDLREFRFPEDFSALDGMEQLQKLWFRESGTHFYPQAVLDAFAERHPGCELIGNIKPLEDGENT